MGSVGMVPIHALEKQWRISFNTLLFFASQDSDEVWLKGWTVK